MSCLPYIVAIKGAFECALGKKTIIESNHRRELYPCVKGS